MYDHQTTATMLAELCVAQITDLQDGSTFIGQMPNEPNECVCFYDTGSDEQDAKIAYDTYGVQVRSKSASYLTGHEILKSIKIELQSINKITLNNGDVLTGIWITSNIAFIGKDEQDRSLFSLNMRVGITPSLTGNRGLGADGIPTNPNPGGGNGGNNNGGENGEHIEFATLPPLP